MRQPLNHHKQSLNPISWAINLLTAIKEYGRRCRESYKSLLHI
ncbi:MULTISPECIES: hypothetical protein [Arenibacter]|nr:MULTISPECIES: hypothetical protein [Arenibacter]